ncbi:g124 [Coccomyxa viridis]|uniref:Thioredoxin n=1 Tax=Coccomyxa viridis TaxID=1274662 RepID=A0ABP1FK42_9CHLO
MGGGNAIVVQDQAQWDEHVKAGKKTVIVDFTATWCGPCKMIGPVFAALSVQHPSLVFLTVDVDKNEAVAAECGISAMPTFQVWQDGKKVDDLVGASKDKLAELVNKYSKDEKTDAKKL